MLLKRTSLSSKPLPPRTEFFRDKFFKEETPFPPFQTSCSQVLWGICCVDVLGGAVPRVRRNQSAVSGPLSREESNSLHNPCHIGSGVWSRGGRQSVRDYVAIRPPPPPKIAAPPSFLEASS